MKINWTLIFLECISIDFENLNMLSDRFKILKEDCPNLRHLNIQPLACSISPSPMEELMLYIKWLFFYVKKYNLVMSLLELGC